MRPLVKALPKEAERNFHSQHNSLVLFYLITILATISAHIFVRRGSRTVYAGNSPKLMWAICCKKGWREFPYRGWGWGFLFRRGGRSYIERRDAFTLSMTWQYWLIYLSSPDTVFTEFFIFQGSHESPTCCHSFSRATISCFTLFKKRLPCR